MSDRTLFTSESVTEGHPDKIADQISDAILDACLDKDPYSRVACETILTTGLAFIAGEITTKAYVDFPSIVRGTVTAVGYTDASYGFDSNTCAVISSIHEQSPDIAMGVDPGGAGDQGMMFGYASNETEELMPMPILLAHRLTMRLAECRKTGQLDFLRPDGKSQVTVEYDENHRPLRVDTVVVSTQHSELVDNKRLRAEVLEHERVLLPADVHVDGDGVRAVGDRLVHLGHEHLAVRARAQARGRAEMEDEGKALVEVLLREPDHTLVEHDARRPALGDGAHRLPDVLEPGDGSVGDPVVHRDDQGLAAGEEPAQTDFLSEVGHGTHAVRGCSTPVEAGCI